MPQVASRVASVKRARQDSKRPATKRLADYPSLFGEDRQPESPYLLLPSVSSERRRFVPIGFQAREVIASNLVFVVPDASQYHFGILTSTMHNAWVRSTCGRLKSDFRYSASIVYNNFPWPLALTSSLSRGERGQTLQRAIEVTAQALLEARAAHAGASLADLYDPNTMPANLVKAHRELDRAVDAAYLAVLPPGARKPKLDTDAQRAAFLFTLYEHLTSLFEA